MPMNMKGKKRKGFTLVELIVVIGVLLTLSILATVAYGNWRLEAYKAAVNSDASAVCRTANLYVALTNDATTAATKLAGGTTGTFDFSLPAGTSGLVSAVDMKVIVPASRATDVISACKLTSGLYAVDSSVIAGLTTVK